MLGTLLYQQVFERSGYNIMMTRTAVRRVALLSAIVMSGGGLYIPRIPLLAIFFISSFLLLWPTIKLSRRLAPIGLLVLSITAIELIRLQSPDFSQIVIRLANFSVAILLLNIYLSQGCNAFLEDLHSITKWFSVQTIVTTGVALIAPGIFFVIASHEVSSFIFLLNYHNQSGDLSFGIPRPNGFFWEPGVLQIYLNIYLYLVLFFRPAGHSVLLALVAIVCTQSTAGVLIMSFLLFSKVVSNIKTAEGLRNLKIIAGAFIVAIPISIYANKNIENKFSGDAKGSFFARQYDTVTGLKIAFDNPLFGIGFNLESYDAKSVSLGYNTDEYEASVFADRGGNSNGLVTLMYSLGFPLAFVIILGMLRQVFFSRRLVFGVLLVLSLLSEPLTLTPFFLMISFSGLAFLLTRK